MTQTSLRSVTKSVRFNAEEGERIEQVSQREHLSEGALLRKLVLDGLDQLQIEYAISDYQSGVLNLGEAAQRAGVGVDRMLGELDRRGIDTISPAHFRAGLDYLIARFGASDALHDALAAYDAKSNR